MRSTIVNLTDESGIQLVDENGNELIAGVLITAYGLSTGTSRLILHGYQSGFRTGGGFVTIYLVDESGNQLVDENGDELIARIGISSHLLSAGETQTILFGG